MRYYLDTEFIDDGSTIDLISTGIVCEDGREYYAQSCEFIVNAVSPWVRANVFPYLRVCPYVQNPVSILQVDVLDHRSMGKCTPEFHLGPLKGADYIAEGIQSGKWQDCPWRTREQIAIEVKAFIDAGEGKPEFWAWCGSYDHVALCQLFGPMINIPDGWPYHINDLQSILGDTPDSDLPLQEGTAHNALSDARHIKRLCEIYACHLPPYVG